MNIEDLKIYAFNTTAVGVTTFDLIEDGLKIVLLLVTIGYTAVKWKQAVDKQCENKKNNEKDK